MLSVEELALLEAIRETGSLSRAAVRLGKAPSTVSHTARQLESRFDALLFDRRRYRLQLTPAGHLLAQEAARLVQDVSRLTQRVKQVAGGWEDRLWIVTDEILSSAKRSWRTELSSSRIRRGTWTFAAMASWAGRRRWLFPACTRRFWLSAMAWASVGCRAHASLRC
jgi:DNA-binding transcriptional LysR family regulator